MFGNNKVKELKKENTDLTYEVSKLKYTNKNLQDKIDNFNRQQELNEREWDRKVKDAELRTEDTERQYKRQIVQLREQLQDKTNDFDLLQERVATYRDLEAKSAELDARELLLNVAEQTAETFKSRLAEERSSTKQHTNERLQVAENKGYYRGLAEGIKNAHNVAKTDRDNMFEIASKALDSSVDSNSETASNVTINNSNDN